MTNATGCCGGMQETAKHEASASALEILAHRFARGEIEKAEFEEKRQIITGRQNETASAADSRKKCCC